MPASVLDLADEYKDQPIEAVARLVRWDGQMMWVLNIRLLDGTTLSEDLIEYRGSFHDEGLNRIAPVLDRAGLVYRGAGAWSGNDETEWTATLYRKVDWRKRGKDS